MIHKIVLISLLLISFSFANAQSEKTDAVYEEMTKEYTLNSDGSYTYHYGYKLLINSYYAFHNLYGEDFIIYDPVWQKLKINRSVTTMADGKQVASPENAFNELLPSFAANVPAWNRLREMVVTHTALERGSVVDFDYQLTSAKGYTPLMAANEILMFNSPVKKLNFIINVPSGATFNYEAYACNVKPTIVKKAGKTTYTWNFTDVASALREDFRPREQYNKPRIVFAAATKNTDGITGFAVSVANGCVADELIKQKSELLANQANTPLLKTLKLRDFVANELNTWQIPLLNTGYRTRTTTEIWNSNGGTEAEKVILLTAMLRSVNIQAEPVAVLPERYYTKKTASPALFERLLVKVTLQGMDPVYISAISSDQQDLGFSLGGKRIISLTAGKNQQTELLSETKNELSLSGKLELGADLSLKGNMDIKLAGRLNPWLKTQKDSSSVQTFLAGSLNNTKVSNIRKGIQDKDISSFNFDYVSGNQATEKAGYVFLRFPISTSGAESWHMTELLSQRTEPFEIPFAIHETEDIFIQIPIGMNLLTQTDATKIENEFGSIELSVSFENDILHIQRKMDIKKTEVPAEKYEVFKTLINSWNSKKYREAVLKKD